MKGISVREVTNENVDELCRICVPPEKRTDHIFMTGMELKKKMGPRDAREVGYMCQVGVPGIHPGGDDPILAGPRTEGRPHPLYLRPRGGELEEGDRDTSFVLSLIHI